MATLTIARILGSSSNCNSSRDSRDFVLEPRVKFLLEKLDKLPLGTSSSRSNERDHTKQQQQQQHERSAITSVKVNSNSCDAGTRNSRSSLAAEVVLSHSELQLMHLLDVSILDARRVLNAVACSLAPRLSSALELLKAFSPSPSPLSCLQLQPGHVAEIVGRAGVGKTQMCLTSAVDAVLRNSRYADFTGVRQEDRENKDLKYCGSADTFKAEAESDEDSYCGGCVYVDTENKFSAERIVEIVQSKMRHCSSDQNVADSTRPTQEEVWKYVIEKIIVFSPQTSSQLVNLFESESMETTLIAKNVRLIVLDSIASLTRFEYKSGAYSIVKRQNMLNKLSASLKVLAETCKIPVLVANQVQGQHQVADESSLQQHQHQQHQNQPTHVHAALGNTWAHSINIRVTFETIDPGSLQGQKQYRRVLDETEQRPEKSGWLRKARLVKAPGVPELECFFHITGSGIEEL